MTFSEKISRFRCFSQSYSNRHSHQKPPAILRGGKVIFTNHEVRWTKNARDVFRSQLETNTARLYICQSKAELHPTNSNQEETRISGLKESFRHFINVSQL